MALLRFYTENENTEYYFAIYLYKHRKNNPEREYLPLLFD